MQLAIAPPVHTPVTSTSPLPDPGRFAVHGRRSVALPVGEPGGWSPGRVEPGRSTRRAGLITGGLDAYFGVPERGAGTALTRAQVEVLAPWLASSTGQREDVVRADLLRVRVVVGGLADGAGNVATTVGHSIYVSDAARATHMLSWAGRTWLVHELVHTAQWRRLAPPHLTDARRDRVFLDAYLGGFVHGDGDVREGALVRALRDALRHRREPVGADGLGGRVGDAIHDAHPMEREAIAVAASFREGTGGRNGDRDR